MLIFCLKKRNLTNIVQIARSLFLSNLSLSFSPSLYIFLPLSLMALIPAADAAGGPARAALSLCIFPVVKQTVAQDSVHADYGGGRLVNTTPLF